MADDSTENFRRPLGVTSDDEGETVRVCVVIPGLKKKTFSTEPKNATVDFKPETQGFELKVCMVGKGNKKGDTYKYQVRKLPDEIDKEKSSSKVKDDQVVLMLHKLNERSWERDLADVGLETYYDETEEQDSD